MNSLSRPMRSVLTTKLKQWVKPYAPTWLLNYHHNRIIRKDGARYQGKTLREVFSNVYETGAWGVAEDPAEFYSGSSSHDPTIVDTYVKAVTAYLASMPSRPDVVDLGCGDFNIGKRIRPACARYIACDVVEPVVRSNRTRFAGLDVDFRCVDITSEPLPAGDVVFLRQVLDHLDNALIAEVLARLTPYRILILTEYSPATPGFTPNLDKPIGSALRLWGEKPSAIELTAPPFNLKVLSTRLLCEVKDSGGVIRTTAYELARDNHG
ncbi:bifunctional 2-polyprenyl-6-hydroxyphenol methylase/3-demethylubiquinol 3-O-methyltransferase UbiG [Cupriavidus pauculus]|uniref:class I SAM-dependent methyltransferase n=1 Tax=Cupriavidus pauculus TaxID=82633 RepID=UPI001EE307A9|nr:class I SAM-dependent methyltransferase [Cupriavidus pauculus]GJG94637.1 methyltransferase domain-containing protein [Cupriavidus pauculus]